MKVLSNNDKQKPKLKKHALEFVNFEEEKKSDPKYKTELCKSWSETGFCVYGNKCRFAHGRHELSIKPMDTGKYKMKECNSFKELGYCMYGTRCNFKHDERTMDSIDRSYYYFKMASQVPERADCKGQRRLEVFEKVAKSRFDVNSAVYLPASYHLNFTQKMILNPQSFQPIYARLS
jgi:hypothetical protein